VLLEKIKNIVHFLKRRDVPKRGEVVITANIAGELRMTVPVHRVQFRNFVVEFEVLEQRQNLLGIDVVEPLVQNIHGSNVAIADHVYLLSPVSVCD
jgi:hypothetical protein